MRSSFYIEATTTKRIESIFEAMLGRWLRPSLNLVTNLIPFGLWQSGTGT